MSRQLSGLEMSEIANRARGMQEVELRYFLKCIPTTTVLEEIARREGVIIDKLNAVCSLWDELAIDKPLDEMDILEKEEVIRRLRRCLYGNE